MIHPFCGQIYYYLALKMFSTFRNDTLKMFCNFMNAVTIPASTVSWSPIQPSPVKPHLLSGKLKHLRFLLHPVSTWNPVEPQFPQTQMSFPTIGAAGLVGMPFTPPTTTATFADRFEPWSWDRREIDARTTGGPVPSGNDKLGILWTDCQI